MGNSTYCSLSFVATIFDFQLGPSCCFQAHLAIQIGQNLCHFWLGKNLGRLETRRASRFADVCTSRLVIIMWNNQTKLLPFYGEKSSKLEPRSLATFGVKTLNSRGNKLNTVLFTRWGLLPSSDGVHSCSMVASFQGVLIIQCRLTFVLRDPFFSLFTRSSILSATFGGKF